MIARESDRPCLAFTLQETVPVNDPFAYAIALHRDNMLLTLTKLSLLVGISLGLVGFGACDGGIHVKGRVYAQKGSAGDSQAFIDQSAPSNGLSPIKDAKVTLYLAGDFSPNSNKNSDLRKASTLTATDGSFEVGGLTSP